jgi:hypothetical protein
MLNTGCPWVRVEVRRQRAGKRTRYDFMVEVLVA